MFSISREISWLGTKLISRSQICFRTVSTGQYNKQQQQNVKSDEKEEDRNNSEKSNVSNPSNFEPPPPLVPRSSLDEFRRPMKPVMKELFRGKCDTAIFSYPDVITNAAYYDVFDRCSKVQQTLKEKKDLIDSIDTEGRVPKDVLLALRSQGFYGLNIPQEDGGEGLSLTETLRLIEELSVNLSLSESIIPPITLGYKALQKFGTEHQKSKYLPSLISGQKIGTVCIKDDKAGCDSNATNVTAHHETEDEMQNIRYVLNGTKTWVTNGPSADLFTVFANLRMKGGATMSADGSSTMASQKQLTAFLVERTMPGVHIHQEVDKKVGLKGLETCTVTFKNVTLTSDYVIGNPGCGTEVLFHILTSDRIVTAAKISAALRIMLNETIMHACRRKQFEKRLIDFDLIQTRLSQSAHHLFALESAVYMTAGLADYQEDPDVAVESAATKRYAVKTAHLIVENCLSILGCSTYLEGNRHRKMADDLRGYDWWEGTDEMLAFYIASAGIAHTANELQDSVKHRRNGLKYPFETMKRLFQLYRVQNDKPRLILRLGDYVHPSLGTLAEKVEYFIHRFHFAVEALLVSEGHNASFKEVDLMRLADIATEIYMMSSALARANRSYCGGHPHAEHEVSLVISYISERDPILKLAIDEVISAYWDKKEKVHNDIAKYMTDRGMYVPVHPVTKNWF